MRCLALRSLLVAVAICSLPWLAAGQEAAAPTAPRQNEPTFLVRVDVNRTTRSYREGDELAINIVSEQDAFAYVFYHQADGKTSLIFPNSVQKNNEVRARQAVAIPAQNDLFRWQIGAPFGNERLTVICSKTPLNSLAAAELTQRRFNPIGKDIWKGVELEIGPEAPAAWGIHQVELTTYARDREPATPSGKRVGLFIGVAQYQFNLEAELAYRRPLNLATCHRDSRILAELLSAGGGLAQQRILNNEQATRKNIEESITTWLPQITRPGDTVFIYFSGHGSQLPDQTGEGKDEADRTDESIIPYDFIDYGILEQAKKRQQAGTLEPANLVRALEAKAIADRAGSPAKAALALERETSITDDVFGHWLQRLDGRQVVVILDSCFAGGLATEEKDLFAKGAAAKFDFLDQELVRLKDIGQRESVLLAASSTRDTAAVRKEEDLSVLTYYLAESIKRAPGRLTLEDSFQHCRTGMEQYFAEARRRGEKVSPHQPYLFNYSSRPVLLKP